MSRMFTREQLEDLDAYSIAVSVKTVDKFPDFTVERVIFPHDGGHWSVQAIDGDPDRGDERWERENVAVAVVSRTVTTTVTRWVPVDGEAARPARPAAHPAPATATRTPASEVPATAPTTAT